MRAYVADLLVAGGEQECWGAAVALHAGEVEVEFGLAELGEAVEGNGAAAGSSLLRNRALNDRSSPAGIAGSVALRNTSSPDTGITGTGSNTRSVRKVRPPDSTHIVAVPI